MKVARKHAVRHARDLLLEAALDAPQWGGAMEAVADACSAQVGQIISLGAQREITFNVFTGVGAGSESVAAACGLGDPALNPRLRAGLNMPLMTPVVDEQYIDEQTRRRSLTYTEFFDPNDFWFNCQAAVLRREDMLVRVSVTRMKREGPFDAEELRTFSELLPFVRAAARLQVALSEAGRVGRVQALDATESAGLLLNSQGLLVGASLAGEQILRTGRYLTVRNGKLEAIADGDRAVFMKRLAAALTSQAIVQPLATDTQVLHSIDGLSRMSVEFHPLPRERSLFDCGAVLLLFKPVNDDRQRAELLQKNFRLTESEADVAMLLAKGLSPNNVAAQRGVSIATIRSQIQSLYSKLDIRRQVELVSLIAGLAS